MNSSSISVIIFSLHQTVFQLEIQAYQRIKKFWKIVWLQMRSVQGVSMRFSTLLVHHGNFSVIESVVFSIVRNFSSYDLRIIELKPL